MLRSSSLFLSSLLRLNSGLQTTVSMIIAALAFTSKNFIDFAITGLKLAIAATTLCGATDVLIAGALIIKVKRIDCRLFYPKTKRFVCSRRQPNLRIERLNS